MGPKITFTIRLATLLVLHAAGAGLASPTVLVTRPLPRVTTPEWLPADNQTLYLFEDGERRSLELNTSSISQNMVYITISPCSKGFHWSLYQGNGKSGGRGDGHLSLIKERSGGKMSVFSVEVSPFTRYVLQLSSSGGGAAVLSVRGEGSRPVRMRLRFRSRRRLSANWEPSPIDPQATTYCVVASHRKNYTSLCMAQSDAKTNRYDRKKDLFADEMDRSNQEADILRDLTKTGDSEDASGMDNKIQDFLYGYSVRMNRKYGRSTKASDVDPVIACVGDRTHHIIENLEPSVAYFVSVFGVAKDRLGGSLLASGSAKPRSTTAKRLSKDVTYKSDVRGKTVYYFKASLGSRGGLWVTISTCGGPVDVEVLVRGKRLYMAKNIEPHSKFFVPAPMPSSSIQETSDEGSVQFDSSSEETKTRFIIKVVPSRSERDAAVGIELTVSTMRWGLNTPELIEDGSTVRELRPWRSCKSIDVAFLPASHNATDIIKYCITARENINTEINTCVKRKSSVATQCVNHIQQPPAKVIVQKVSGLKAGKKYEIQVTASHRGSFVPYKLLYAETNASCKD